jgi:hypothetical protein
MEFSKKHQGKATTMRCNRCLAVVGVAFLMIVGCRHRDDAVLVPVAVQVTTLRREPIVSETRFSATVREQGQRA